MEKRFSLEHQLFDWDGWDDDGVMCASFYNVVLKVPIGEFPAGSKFPVCSFDGEHSCIQLYEENETHHTFELKLSVGAKTTFDGEV